MATAKPAAFKRPRKRNMARPPPKLVAKPAAPSKSTDKAMNAMNVVNAMNAKSLTDKFTRHHSSFSSSSKTSKTSKTEQDQLATDKPTMQSSSPSTEATTEATTVSSDSSSTKPAAHDMLHEGSATSKPFSIKAPADGLIRIADNANPTPTSSLTVGWVEKCNHPGFLGGLCIVCGASTKQSDETTGSLLSALNQSAAGQIRPDRTSKSGDFGVMLDATAGTTTSSSTSTSAGTASSSRSSSSNMAGHYDSSGSSSRNGELSQITVSGGITMTVSKSEGKLIAQQSFQRLWKVRKLHLVLDLDHTLVHATADQRAQQHTDQFTDCRSLVLPASEGAPGKNDGPMRWMKHYVKLRPHVKEFLTDMESMYEISIYTAGTRQYAEEIAMILARHIVGSPYDQTELDEIRHRTYRAEMEWKKHSALLQSDDDGNRKRKLDGGMVQETLSESSSPNRVSSKNTDQHGNTKMDGVDEKTPEDDSEVQEPARKKKKVLFGMPPKVTQTAEDGAATSTLKSDHMTEEQLKGLRQKLEEVEQLEQQARALRQRLFGSRIVSRTDVGDLGRDVKSLRRIFPCGGSMAAVVDDREDVWANATDNTNSATVRKGEPPDNLLLVRPYHWQSFVGFADVNNSSGDDLSGDGTDGSNSTTENDVQLRWTGDILKRLHERYYDPESRSRRLTAPVILRQMRSEVLKGSTLVLSGLVPLHQQRQHTDDRQGTKTRPPIIRYAENMGSKLSDSVGPHMTHLIAARDGTDKVLNARKVRGCAVVKPSWLLESYWSLRRRDIKDHLLNGALDSNNARLHVETKVANVGSGNSGSSSSEEDDDFVAEFEEELMNDG
jgi:RNA polymerase II subunit A-like phosphatase